MPEENVEGSQNNKCKLPRFCSKEDNIGMLLTIFIVFAYIDSVNAYLEQERDDHHQLPPFCEPRQLHINDPTLLGC